MNVSHWGSDAIISMPSPPDKSQPGLRNIGDGFTMTHGGIYPEMDLAVLEEYRTPTYAPPVPLDDNESRSA